MLKSYDVTELRAGMKVGRAVKDFDGTTLIKAGVKLTSEMTAKIFFRFTST